MQDQTPFYRVRWLIQAQRPIRIHSWQYAIVIALIKKAALGSKDSPPLVISESHFMVEAPETGRTLIDQGETFAFGATIIEPDPVKASRLVHDLSARIARLGSEKPDKITTLGGNYNLIEVQDVFGGRLPEVGENLQSLKASHADDEFSRLVHWLGEPVSIRFLSPLRLKLPGTGGPSAERFADEHEFLAGQFLRMTQKRLRLIGLGTAPDSSDDSPLPDSAIELSENWLCRLDLGYGPRSDRENIGGALGRILVRVHDPRALGALIWGQYAHVGKNVRFGLGKYRIEQLGTDRYACSRSASLLELGLSEKSIRAAELADPAVGDLAKAAKSVLDGKYTPAPTQEVTIRDSDGAPRRLSIPSRRDRSLQRMILGILAPAFDKLFETSSFAWRQGLSRESAARRIESLSDQGWNYAVRADFDRFFETVPRRHLIERLSAWTGDERMTAAVVSLLPPGEGIPTGAPLSPLLGNLFLDRFDEQFKGEGGQLIRYADDFLVLTKDRNQAEQMHERVVSLAESLKLKLNDDSTVIDFADGFDFLGYRFGFEHRWEYAGPRGPKRVTELGWQDADRVPPLAGIKLPGETNEQPGSSVLIAGPGLESVEITSDRIEFRTGPMPDSHAIEGIERIVLIGPARLAANVPGKLLKAGVTISFVSDHGWPIGELAPCETDDADVIAAQCRSAIDPLRTLRIARKLIQAKLNNFAALATAAGDDKTAGRIRESARQAGAASSLETLRGIEGNAARIWYESLTPLLGNGFRMRHRIAPDASDPVNVMLNLGHTMLHRHAITAIRAAGLSPAIGFLHVSRARFPALAADLQEPFRHLVERAVILATRRIKPRHFVVKDNGPYPLVMEPAAAKTFHALLQRSWRQSVIASGQSKPRAWLAQMLSTTRSLARHLVDSDQPFSPFSHATETTTRVSPDVAPEDVL